MVFWPSSVWSSTFILSPFDMLSSFRSSSGIVILPFRVTEIIATSFRTRITSVANVGKITFIYFIVYILPVKVT